MNDTQALLALVVVAGIGCKPDYVEPPETEPTGGFGDTGGSTDTEGGNPEVCFPEDAPAEAVRWQCEGFAEAAVRFTPSEDAVIPDWVPDDVRATIQAILDYGRFDWNEPFGPNAGETYDQPGVDACCLPDIGDADAQAGADETGAPDPSAGEDGEDAEVPQPAMACAHDCADQACRQAIRDLRTQAEAIPGGLDLAGASFRDQLIEVSNWLATGQPCYDAMVAGGVVDGIGGYQISGTVVLPTPDGRWPAFAELSVEGDCVIYDWYLPEQGEPNTCTGINDNNDDPFGSGGPGGSGFGDFDTFAPTGGELELDGPKILGIHAAGTAPILGLGDACPRGECSRVDAWITAESLELARMVLLAPSSMSWEQDGMRLTIEGMHAIVEHPRSIPLVTEGDVMRFELLAGELEVMLAGRVQGVPITVTVPNVTPVEGTVRPLPDGSHGLTIAPFELEHRDGYGTWTMHVTLGELVALEHSSTLPLTLRVTDDTGRSTWAHDAVADDG